MFYTEKQLGDRSSWRKVLSNAAGCFWFLVLFGLVVGPLILFSDLAGMQGPNPVFETSVKVAFRINSTLSKQDLFESKIASTGSDGISSTNADKYQFYGDSKLIHGYQDSTMD